MEFALWLALTSGFLHLPAADSVRTESLPPAPVVAAPLASKEALGLAWPGVGPFRPELLAAERTAQRPRAIEHSDFYYARLTIHRVASLATAPLFVAEYFIGQKLISNPPGSQSTLEAHRLVALGLAGLFGVNTVTGAWNLWDSRKDSKGRARRYIHAALMIAADAGFVATASAAPSRRRISADPSLANRHRGLAIASMSTALASYVMMLLWKN